MISTPVDWAKLLDVVNVLAGPLLTAVAVFAAVLFFRIDRRKHTICLLLGCTLIFVQRTAHVVAWLPGIGYFDRGHATPTSQILVYNNFTVLLNLLAWTLLVYGLVAVATLRFKQVRTEVAGAVV